MAATIRDDALCIRHWDWSETSQTVSLFTREHGVVRGLAKGSRRERAPFSGGLEVLTRGEVVAIVRPSGALATITAWDLTDAYSAIRRSLRSFYVGLYLIDLVHHAVTDADPHPGLFDRLVGVLGTLGSAPEAALVRGQWAVLDETGYAPTIPDPGTADRALCFLPREGVFLAGSAALARADGWRARPETLDVLRRAAREPSGEAPGDAASVARAARLLGSYLRHVLGEELPSARPVFGEGGLVS